MKIEEAIKQTKPFDTEFQKAGVNLMYSFGWYTGQLKSFLKTYGLTLKQYNILRILKGAGKPVSTSFVRERLLDKMSDVSRIADRMQEKGLIEKCVCKNDKRLVDISLTAEAENVLVEVKKASGEMDRILESLSTKEAQQLNLLLDKMRGK